mmetsp:Transcript_1151/g.2357  ORF Transcript_1151/g.2357 Transcript_1151/m.2357 type:complete len:265 (-) Transcript_1151:30-824(-)
MNPGALERVVTDFNSTLVELQEATVLLKHDGLFDQDVKQLNNLVDLVEDRLAGMEKAVLDHEKNTIASLDASIESAKMQQKRLKDVLERIPAYMPSEPPRVVQHKKASSPAAAAGGVPLQQQESQRKQNKTYAMLERRYIDEAELDGVSSYMKGRLTVDKMNAALDELAGHAEANAELVHAAKRNKTSGVDRKHAMWLLTHIAKHPSVAGTYFALDSDLKTGNALKTDKTSKSILTVLRHLRRIKEVRIPVQGEHTHVVYTFVT